MDGIWAKPNNRPALYDLRCNPKKTDFFSLFEHYFVFA